MLIDRRDIMLLFEMMSKFSENMKTALRSGATASLATYLRILQEVKKIRTVFLAIQLILTALYKGGL